MPTRFPGMDPWLEAPSRWTGVHATLIAIFRELLTVQIRPRYFADIESRIYVLDEDDPAQRVIIPDLVAFRGDARKEMPAAHPARAAATPASAVVTLAPGGLPVREGRVVIRTVDGHDIVAVL